MVLSGNSRLGTSSEFELRDDDRPTEYTDDHASGRSNFVAFLMGGVLIAGGLLSFLYYDSNNLQGTDQMTNGSYSQSLGDMPSVPSIRILPDNPGNK